MLCIESADLRFWIRYNKIFNLLIHCRDQTNSMPPEKHTNTFVQWSADIAQSADWTADDLVTFLSLHASNSHFVSRNWNARLFEWFQIDVAALSKSLVSLLRLSAPMLQTKRKSTLERKPARNTDWAKCQSYRSGFYYLKYPARSVTSVPNSQIGAYLIQTSEYLISLIKIFGGVTPAALPLESATLHARKIYGIHTKPAQLRPSQRKKILEKLISCDLAGIDLTSLEHFENRSRLLSDLDHSKLKAFSEKLSAGIELSNPDLLFEVLTTLAITKTASLNFDFKVGDFSYFSSRLAGIELHREIDGFRKLVISKRKPAFLGTQSSSGVESEYKSTMKSMGDNATGLEPDICLEFFNDPDGTKPDLTHLADAKNNQKGDGRAYRAISVKAAFHYLHSYSSFKNQITVPAFTLFFHQGGTKVAGKERSDTDPDFDDFKKFEVIGLGYCEGDFEGNVLKNWFSALLSHE